MSVVIPDPATTDWVPLAYGATIQTNVPACRVYHNAAQSIPDSTPTILAFNSERFDTDNMHDTATNNSRLTCRTAGKYLVTASLGFSANANGTRQVLFSVNGLNPIIAIDERGAAPGGRPTEITLTSIYDFAVGDYVELRVMCNGAGATTTVDPSPNYSPEFSMTYIGPGLLGRGVQNLTGTFAARPAANTVPPGTTYYATDTSQMYLSDGAAWTKTSGVAAADLPGYPSTQTRALAGDGTWQPFGRQVTGSWTAGTLFEQHGVVTVNFPAGLSNPLVNLLTPWPSFHAQFFAAVWPAAHWSFAYNGSLAANNSQGYVAVTNNGAAQNMTVNWYSLGN